MDRYIEQSVSGESSVGKSILYAACWLLCGILLLCAILSGASILGGGTDGFTLRWPALVLTLLLLGCAFAVFRFKDRLRVEYDYILRDGELEICGVYNARRRRRLAVIPLDQITCIGSAEGADYENALRRTKNQKHEWYLNAQQKRFYLCYMKENTRQMALLELNEAIQNEIRTSRQLQMGAWRA